MIAIEGAEGHATCAYQARPLVDAVLDGGLARLTPTRRIDVHLNQLQHLATLPVLLCDSLRPVDLTDASQLEDSHRAYGSHRSSQLLIAAHTVAERPATGHATATSRARRRHRNRPPPTSWRSPT